MCRPIVGIHALVRGCCGCGPSTAVTLLGPGQARDAETTLLQLRCVMKNSYRYSLLINIHHSSLRDYVSNPSICNLYQVQHFIQSHCLFAHSPFRLMMYNILGSTALLNAFLESKNKIRDRETRDQSLKELLTFTIEPPEPLQVLMVLVIQGDHHPGMTFWLETPDGRSRSRIQGRRYWCDPGQVMDVRIPAEDSAFAWSLVDSMSRFERT